ncbi:MAG: hypothetical protein ACRDOB_00840, partial [Streptosporangiaceae bacterium]
MTSVIWLLAMFSTTFAPAGTGKVPSAPSEIVRLELLGLGLGDDAAADALRLAAAALVAGGGAVVIPAVQPATVKLAAQLTRA